MTDDPAAPPAPRVLLVEDDPAIRLFVAMALEDLALELQAVATLAEARAALLAHPASLVLTDLRLPDGHGLDLVAWIAARRAPGASLPRVAVFSAGLEPDMRARLERLGAWRLLPKPAPLSVLRACVGDALAAAAPEGPADADAPAPGDAVSRAIAQHFDGDAGLHDEFLAACVAQFPADIAAGDAAVAGADLPALRRLAHSLTSVLRTLGRDAAADRAGALEAAAAGGRSGEAAAGWSRLREVLRDAPADGH